MKEWGLLVAICALFFAALLGVGWGVVAITAVADHQKELKACRDAGGRPAGDGDNWFCDRTAAGSAGR